MSLLSGHLLEDDVNGANGDCASFPKAPPASVVYHLAREPRHRVRVTRIRIARAGARALRPDATLAAPPPTALLSHPPRTKTGSSPLAPRRLADSPTRRLAPRRGDSEAEFCVPSGRGRPLSAFRERASLLLPLAYSPPSPSVVCRGDKHDTHHPVPISPDGVCAHRVCDRARAVVGASPGLPCGPPRPPRHPRTRPRTRAHAHTRTPNTSGWVDDGVPPPSQT